MGMTSLLYSYVNHLSKGLDLAMTRLIELLLALRTQGVILTLVMVILKT